MDDLYSYIALTVLIRPHKIGTHTAMCMNMFTRAPKKCTLCISPKETILRDVIELHI